jgi:hypothetical protein
VTTLAAVLGTERSATLNGAAMFNGAVTTEYFEWGVSTSYGNVTAPQSSGTGSGSNTWSAVVSELSRGVVYHYRAVATNLHGASYGTDQTFRLPTTLTVSNLSDSGPGSLRDAIEYLRPGDTVRFAPSLTGTIFVTNGDIAIDKSLRLEGPGDNRVVLSGGNANRLFRIENGQVLISGLTMTYGRALGTNGTDGASNTQGGSGDSAMGGAILNRAHLTLSNCVFASCTAVGGNGGRGGPDTLSIPPGDGGLGGPALGGALASFGTLALTDCRFRDNRAQGGLGGNGGTGFNHPTAAGGAGRHGGGGFGGAVYSQGTLGATNCAFFDNFAAGGIGGNGGNSRLFGGSGGVGGESGGGALYSRGTLTLINCTFARGLADGGDGGNTGVGFNGSGVAGSGGLGSGGALANFGDGLLVHCTVSDSRAGGGAGGVAVSLPGQSGIPGEDWGGGIANEAQTGVILILNTVVARNSVSFNTNAYPDIGESVTSLGHNFIGKDVLPFGWSASDIRGTPALPRDPQLASLNDLARSTWTLPPLRGSPLIDAGDDSVLGSPLYLVADQRGGPRRTLGHVDIGAVEIGAAVRLTRLERNGVAYDVSFQTEQSFPHRLESRDTLTAGPWTTVGPIALSGTGGEVTVQDSRPRSLTNRFYRAVLIP